MIYFEFLQGAVTLHAAAMAAAWLCAAGFTRLEEADYWNLEPGKGYYTTRNQPVHCFGRGACRSTPSAAGASWPAAATPRRGKSRPRNTATG